MGVSPTIETRAGQEEEGQAQQRGIAALPLHSLSRVTARLQGRYNKSSAATMAAPSEGAFNAACSARLCTGTCSC